VRDTFLAALAAAFVLANLLRAAFCHRARCLNLATEKTAFNKKSPCGAPFGTLPMAVQFEI
jgi:hypothetical protein